MGIETIDGIDYVTIPREALEELQRKAEDELYISGYRDGYKDAVELLVCNGR